MRRTYALALSALMAVSIAATTAEVAYAQSRGDQGGGEDEAAKKRKRDEEWNQPKAPLRQLRNAGPCPYVKVLYDASRYVQFKDAKESAGQAGFTGEIQSIASGCAYKSDEPIRIQIEALFQLAEAAPSAVPRSAAPPSAPQSPPSRTR